MLPTDQPVSVCSVVVPSSALPSDCWTVSSTLLLTLLEDRDVGAAVVVEVAGDRPVVHGRVQGRGRLRRDRRQQPGAVGGGGHGATSHHSA